MLDERVLAPPESLPVGVEELVFGNEEEGTIVGYVGTMMLEERLLAPPESVLDGTEDELPYDGTEILEERLDAPPESLPVGAEELVFDKDDVGVTIGYGGTVKVPAWVLVGTIVDEFT